MRIIGLGVDLADIVGERRSRRLIGEFACRVLTWWPLPTQLVSTNGAWPAEATLLEEHLLGDEVVLPYWEGEHLGPKPRWPVLHDTVEEVGARADRVIADLVTADGPGLVFAHGHLLRILAARWMGLAAVHGQLLGLDTATVSTLGWERETRVIRHWNEECHLRSLDPTP